MIGSKSDKPENGNMVMFVDDDRNILTAVRRVFYNRNMSMLFADNPYEALKNLEKEEIAVVVSDYQMPGMTGIELLSQTRAVSPDTIKILMTAHADLNTAINAINSGEVFKFITKPWEDDLLIEAVEEAIKRYRIIQSMKKGDEGHLLSLAQTIELKDPYTRGHCDRVADYALVIGDALNLPQDIKTQIKYGSWLHDCGKIGIPENVLNKPGSLDPQEMEIIQKHPVLGAEVARLSNRSEIIVNIILHHHEKYDGTGYPERRKGESIPMEARIVSIADIFDALISNRPYRKAYKLYEALEILRSMRETHLDPKLLDLFMSVMETREV